MIVSPLRKYGKRVIMSHVMKNGEMTVCGRELMSDWRVHPPDPDEHPTCKKCIKVLERYCPYGHDLWKVGRSPHNNRCMGCVRERDREYKRRQHPEYEHERLDPTTVPNMRAVRYNLGLTQKEMATYCDISVSQVSRLEKGSRASERTRTKILIGVKRAQREMREKILERDRRRLDRRIAS